VWAGYRVHKIKRTANSKAFPNSVLLLFCCLVASLSLPATAATTSTSSVDDDDRGDGLGEGTTTRRALAASSGSIPRCPSLPSKPKCPYKHDQMSVLGSQNIGVKGLNFGGTRMVAHYVGFRVSVLALYDYSSASKNWQCITGAKTRAFPSSAWCGVFDGTVAFSPDGSKVVVGCPSWIFGGSRPKGMFSFTVWSRKVANRSWYGSPGTEGAASAPVSTIPSWGTAFLPMIRCQDPKKKKQEQQKVRSRSLPRFGNPASVSVRTFPCPTTAGHLHNVYPLDNSGYGRVFALRLNQQNNQWRQALVDDTCHLWDGGKIVDQSITTGDRT